jgi:hypothetical protein
VRAFGRGRGAWTARGVAFNYVSIHGSSSIGPWHGTAWPLSINLILSHRGVGWRGRVCCEGDELL